MDNFIDRMKAFKNSLSERARFNCEVNLGLRDPKTGLSKDWAGNVVDRKYIERQIERVGSKIQNEIDKEEKERLMSELQYWKNRLKSFDKEHGTHENGRDRD